MITHASADHFGGDAAIKQRFPQVKIVAHHQDAASITSHETFIKEHKSWPKAYGLPAQEVSAQDFEKHFGPEVRVDLSVLDGEWITLTDSWQIQLLHSPGHTPGHLMIYDPKNQAIFAGDAVLGEGVPSIDGAFTMPPHYFEVDWYLATIEKITNLAPKYFFGTHYHPFAGQEVFKFLNASKNFVTSCNDKVLNIFRAEGKSLGAIELLAHLREDIGISAAENQYQLLARAHINHLTSQGELELIIKFGKKKWHLKK